MAGVDILASAMTGANAAYLVRQQGLDPGAARGLARALLASMPAWKGHV